MRRLANAVILASGWRRALVAAGSGALGALAMPPFGVWPALAVSLAAAVWLLDGSVGGGRVPALSRSWSAAWAGWFWGLGYFTAGLWWIGAAFLVEAASFAWLLPFGVLGLPALLAIFTGLGFAIARALWSGGPARLPALAFGLTVGEWLRGHAFTGFPWNTLGMALAQDDRLIQSGSLLGLYGLTIVTVLLLSTPACLGTGLGRADRLLPIGAAAFCLVALAAYGALRLPSGAVPSVVGVKLRVMQPNLSQDDKFNRAAGAAILDRYIALSERSTGPDNQGLAAVTHLVWPESAFPFLLHREPNALSRLAAMLGPSRTVLVTGAAREGEPLPGEDGRRFFNAIQVVAPDGSIVSGYDKVHLVPFGEYVPAALDGALRTIGIRQFVRIPGGFTAGVRHTALSVAGLPLVAATICYEAIFPDEAVPTGPRPGLILNVTNDGWFGDTPGPRQHLAQARLRAVEQGLPVVRAANTGISAVIDPYGRTVAMLPVGREGVLDSALPQALPATPFGRYGQGMWLALLGLCLVGAMVGGLPGRRPGRRAATAI